MNTQSPTQLVNDRAEPNARTATLHRMVMHDHICPFGLKSLALLRSKGYRVEDHWLTTRGEQDALKRELGVATTPQTFIDGKRIGGYDDLRRHFGLRVHDPKAETYRPVIAVFALAAIMALAISWSLTRDPFTWQALVYFAGISTGFLALLKLRGLDRFSNMFIGYDLLGQRFIPYSYVYPFAEAAVGVLMLAMPLPAALAVAGGVVAVIIGGIGAVSVFKAVYIDHRHLKCACVGGDSNVPLGFVSLTENLLMVAMGVWMFAGH